MCGIFGSYSPSGLSEGEVRMTNLLGFLSQLRGSDSTGITLGYQRKKDKRNFYTIYKEVGDFNHFMSNSKTMETIKDSSKTYLMIGHCRSATVGRVTRKLAHPFHFGKIMGVHNGTIKKLEDTKIPEISDSYRLYEMISKVGIDKTIKELGDDGAMALVWVDYSENNHTLNFYRNSQRTLYFAPNTAESTLYWASEYDYITFAEKRSSPILKNPTLFSPNVLYSAPIGSTKFSERKIEPPTSRVYHFSPRSSFTHDWETWDSGLDNNSVPKNKRREEPAKLLPKPTSVPSVKKETVEYEAYIGFNNKLISPSEADEILSEGCALCGRNSISHKDVVYWIGAREFVDLECADDLGLNNLEQLAAGKVTKGELVDATMTSYNTEG